MDGTMKTKLTIKEKIQYLSKMSYLLQVLNDQLEEAKNEKADYMLKQKEEPDNIWLEDDIERKTTEIKAINKLIEDLENLTE